MTPLPYIHIFAPLILVVPVLTLIPRPKEPIPTVPGLRPITIRRVIPRRFLILTTLILLAFTSFLDAALLVADLLTSSARGGQLFLVGDRLGLDSWVVYSVGGVIIWGLTAIFAEYRGRWGDKSIVTLATLAFFFEIPNLVYLSIGVSRSSGYWRFLPILALVPPCLRLLHLPVLFVAVSTPRISYDPVEEDSPLLQDGEADNRSRDAYGTFDTASSTSRAHSADPRTGATTPATNKPPVSIPKHIKIPKQLGETRKEDPPLEWRVVLSRMRKLAPYLWPSTSRKLQFYVFICVLSLLAGRVLQPALPLALGQVVRVLTKHTGDGNGPSVWPAFITYFVIRLCVSGSGIIYFVQQRLWIPVSQYSDREMMMMCFNHLLNLSLAYHTRRNTGEVLKIIDRGSAINNLFQVVLFTAVPTFLDMIIAYGLFFWLYGPVLAGVSVTVMVFYMILAITATSRRTVIRRQLTDRDVKQRGIISDVLTNWESVKYFTAERRERDRFHEAVLSYQEAEAKWTASYQVVYLLQTFLLTLGLMCGSIMIAYRVLHGTSDAAEFVVFIQYFQQLSSPLDRLGMLYQQLNRNSIDAEKMFALLAETTEVNDQPGAKDLVVTDGVIEFDNVKFSYDGKVQALKGVSFKIEKGQSMALVGESGSGKSTILRLLYRFYDIDSGAIRIDGQDISKVTQSSLRRAIGIVPQDSVLWNDTIGANVSYGKEGATDEEIIAAAQAAKLHERILSFTDGYSTIVGERGIRLSGGEKQRVSLARMFLKSPAILVLDEATSALDTETEREIQRALTELAEGRTSLSIAHRLSTIINSDKIVVMKDGEVIENGGYKALLELNGVFAGMWKKQIFTEEEMLANAAGRDEKDLIELDEAKAKIKSEKHLLDQDEDETRTPSGSGGSSSITQRAPDEAITPKGAHQDQDEAPTQDVEVDNEDQVPPEGYQVDEQADTPETYAEVVKYGEESADDHTATEDKAFAQDAETEETTMEPLSVAPVAEGQSRRTSVPFPSAAPTVSTPEKRMSLPPMPRMTSSQSATSNLSDLGSIHSSPGGTPDESKARKRLSSLKGFVRRISDQGLSRSPSLGGKGKSPMGELNEAQAMSPAPTAVPAPVPTAPAPAPSPAPAPMAESTGNGSLTKGKEEKPKKKKKSKKGK